MSKQVTVKTSGGKYFYKMSEYDGRYYCMKLSSSFFPNWIDIGSARGMEAALAIIKSHASKYGSVYSLYLD